MPTTDVTLTKTLGDAVAVMTIGQIGRRELGMALVINGELTDTDTVSFDTPAERDMQFANVVRDLTGRGYTPIER